MIRKSTFSAGQKELISLNRWADFYQADIRQGLLPIIPKSWINDSNLFYERVIQIQ